MSAYNSGTPQKCKACDKTVYIAEMVAPGGVAYHNTCFRCTHCNGRLSVTVDGDFYHQNCFKCAHGGCKLTTSSYAALDGLLYCKPHFSQLFKEKGCYNHLTKSTSRKNSAALQLAAEAELAKAQSPRNAAQDVAADQ
nr:LIM domain-containing protein WLIM2b-like [Ipomoea batatas]GMD82364.1 LIM domain-containing protein WLIM2b-like [Ipomoea batatas]